MTTFSKLNCFTTLVYPVVFFPCKTLFLHVGVQTITGLDTFADKCIRDLICGVYQTAGRCQRCLQNLPKGVDIE